MIGLLHRDGGIIESFSLQCNDGRSGLRRRKLAIHSAVGLNNQGSAHRAEIVRWVKCSGCANRNRETRETRVQRFFTFDGSSQMRV